MKTPDEIKRGLELCACGSDEGSCMEVCSYHGGEAGKFCTEVLASQALSYIRELEAKVAEYEKYAPPVTPGMPIFSVAYDDDDDRCIVTESKVLEIWYNCNGWFFTEEGHRGPGFRPRQIGHIVFLDKDSAQRKCDSINGCRPTEEERKAAKWDE